MAPRLSRTPPKGAPEGTVWFGGPVDRFRVSLTVHGDHLDPDEMTRLLGCQPNSAARRGEAVETPEGIRRTPHTGRWILSLNQSGCGPGDDVDDAIEILLAKLPAEPEFWRTLTSSYRVRVSCGLFLEAANRGVEIPPVVSRMLADRNLSIGFDIYCDPPSQG